MPRSSSATLLEDAFSALSDALAGNDLEMVVRGSPAGPGRADVTVRAPGGQDLVVEVSALSQAVPSAVLRLIGARRHPQTIAVLVADAIPEASKQLLRDAGWGWLDRRGHLYLRGPGLVLNDTTVRPSPRIRSLRRPEPLRGRGGLTAAGMLLMHPDDPPGVREIARVGGLSPGTVSAALAAIREASLIDDRGRPLVPELFWALADAWRPVREPLVDKPDPMDRTAGLTLSFGLDRAAPDGWALSGTLAALEWGAPAVVTADYPPDFYVPNAATLRGALQRFGRRGWEHRGCSVALAATSIVTMQRFHQRSRSRTDRWPLAHPLFVALDLAQDAARGVEILAEWTPPETFHRVW